jgi:excisionase family DNA binding protein
MRSTQASAQALPERLFIPVIEAADILGLDPRTLRRAIEAGTIPATRVGVKILIPTAWLRAQAEQSGDDTP